jgi:hypothetical protein
VGNEDTSPERETDQEQRDRKDTETEEYRKQRQERLGHVEVPGESDDKDADPQTTEDDSQTEEHHAGPQRETTGDPSTESQNPA